MFRATQVSHVLVLTTLAAGLVSCGGGAYSPPDGSTWFQLHANEVIHDPVMGNFATDHGGVSVSAQLLQAELNAIGTQEYYLPRFTDYLGLLPFNNPKVPGTWRFYESTGPCAGQHVETAQVSHMGNVEVYCHVYVNPARDFGFLEDGTAVYTGGDDKLVVHYNAVLNPGECRTSASGALSFCYQHDGNLVLYRGSSALWASNTNGTSAGFAIMQNDGNLVVYNASSQAVPRRTK